MKKLGLIILCMMANGAVFGQLKDFLQAGSRSESLSCFGQLVSYEVNGSSQADQIESIYLTLNEADRVQCRLKYKDSEAMEYWTFKVGSLRNENGVLTAEVSNIVFDDTNAWGYYDDKATGVYTFQEEGLETVSIKKFYIHKGYEIAVVISWRRLQNR